jgi:cell division protein FtsW
MRSRRGVMVRRPAMLSRSATQQRRHRPDYFLVLISLLLLVTGLIVVYSISPGLSVQKHVSENYFVIKQLLAIGLGVIGFSIVAVIPLRNWQRLQQPLIGIAVAATITALIMPASTEYPAHRWIRFGGLSLQSVEIIKFSLLICLASFLAERLQKGMISDAQKTLRPILLVLGGLGVVVAIAQRDLGSTGVLVAIMAAMGFVAGLPMKRVLQIGGIIAVGTVLAISTSAYRRDRVLTFLHPEKDCLSTGYQACQALIAVGSGGIFGKGLAHSVQAYGYLPEAANDSIFAIFAEKFGFVGVTLLLCLLMAFFARLKNIMERAPDAFSRLVVAGVLAWLSTQTIINIGAMIGLLPLKGITLPFISYGGTSIIFVLAALGLVFNISRYTTYTVNADSLEGRSHENPAVRRGNRRPYYANISRRP